MRANSGDPIEESAGQRAWSGVGPSPCAAIPTITTPSADSLASGPLNRFGRSYQGLRVSKVVGSGGPRGAGLRRSRRTIGTALRWGTSPGFDTLGGTLPAKHRWAATQAVATRVPHGCPAAVQPPIRPSAGCHPVAPAVRQTWRSRVVSYPVHRV